MDSESRSAYLSELLALGRPPQKEVVMDDGSTQSVFDDNEYSLQNSSQPELAPEKVIEETVTRYVDDENREELEQFSRFFFKHFFRNREHVYPVIMKAIGKNEVGVTPEYLQFFRDLLVDAATFGFPSIYQMYFSKDRQTMEELSGRSVFDVRNVLALRIYLADLIHQTLEHKQDTLKLILEEIKQATSEEEQKRILSKIPAIFGTMPEAKAGVVSGVDVPMKFVSSQPTTQLSVERKFTYDRMQDHALYLPDADRIEGLLYIGKLLGRDRLTDRKETFTKVGGMSTEQLLLIFPDFVDKNIQVPSEHKSAVMDGLGMDYDVAMNLFSHQLECDSDPSRSFPKVK